MLLWLFLLGALVATTLYAQEVPRSGVLLEWDHHQGSMPAVKFRVYKQQACAGPWVALADVEPVASVPARYQYIDYEVSASRTYCWQVTAVGAGGEESGPVKRRIFSHAINPGRTF